jgi:hypothetical protein
MKSFTVEPGNHISPDVGLSDEFTVRGVDDAGNAILFDFEPREWLAEWEVVRRANLPVGATYSRLLLCCASRFHVHFQTNGDGERFWEFTVFDILSRTDRKLTLSEGEVSSLAEKVRKGLNR